MRKLLLGAAAIALSGCSWSGGSYNSPQYGTNQGQYSYGEVQQEPCCELSRWNLEGAVGPEFFIGGDAITGDKTNNIPNVFGNNLSMKDAYDPGMRYELGGSYALNPNRKVTFAGSYAKADGEEVNLGTINGNLLAGELTDYERYGLEVGVRQYFQPQPVAIFNSIRPYVEGKVGAAKIKDIDIKNPSLGLAGIPNDIPFYKGGWVPTAAGMIGAETPLFEHTTIGLETGVRYTGHPRTDTSVLNAGQPLAGTNNGGSSWTVPVMLRGRYRF